MIEGSVTKHGVYPGRKSLDKLGGNINLICDGRKAYCTTWSTCTYMVYMHLRDIPTEMPSINLFSTYF